MFWLFVPPPFKSSSLDSSHTILGLWEYMGIVYQFSIGPSLSTELTTPED